MTQKCKIDSEESDDDKLLLGKGMTSEWAERNNDVFSW